MELKQCSLTDLSEMVLQRNAVQFDQANDYFSLVEVPLLYEVAFKVVTSLR